MLFTNIQGQGKSIWNKTEGAQICIYLLYSGWGKYTHCTVLTGRSRPKGANTHTLRRIYVLTHGPQVLFRKGVPDILQWRGTSTLEWGDFDKALTLLEERVTIFFSLHHHIYKNLLMVSVNHLDSSIYKCPKNAVFFQMNIFF